MRVAIVYDRINKWGGAERVLLELQKLFPNAQLFTSVYSSKNAVWAQKFLNINTSPLNKIPYLRDKHEYLSILMPVVFEGFDLSDMDLVVSVTSEAAKGVLTGPNTLHICYCLTPTRYLWSHYETYFSGKIFKMISNPFVKYLRKWDFAAAQRPDVFVAISTEVKNRIKKYYGRDSVVIYPPLTLVGNRHSSSKLPKEYYLLVSRLVRYKRVDLAIEAFNKLGKPLYIVGVGRQLGKLKKIAGKNVKFVGTVTDENLSGYYENARALIFPQYEDFGLVAVEAQSFGVPVIAYGKGGILDIIKDGVTGVLFDTQNVESLTLAVVKFEKLSLDATIIRHNAKRYLAQNFQKSFRRLVVDKHRL